MVKKSTLEEFIIKAIKVHGNKYSYAKVYYVNSSTKVDIICNKCKRSFKQTPNKHLMGQNGCCFNTNIPMTTQVFINKVKLIHGNKYSYDNTEYVNSKTLVKIICNSCGKQYTQRPLEHLKGHNCCRCYTYHLTYTTDDFIASAIEVHGDVYDYSCSVYNGTNTVINIRCKNCNIMFYPTPSNHLFKKSGCPNCYLIKKTYTKDTFVHIANTKHNNFFNYEKTNYINNKNKITITCPIHGDFITSPRNHIKHAYSCPGCESERMSGENSPNWKGGISCGSYCPIWSDKGYKDYIRERDNNVCQNPYCYNKSNRLSIHHIDYDKKNCHPSNLITVCDSCNSKANFDRIWHKKWYQTIMQKRTIKYI